MPPILIKIYVSGIHLRTHMTNIFYGTKITDKPKFTPVTVLVMRILLRVLLWVALQSIPYRNVNNY
jgi:hypothetical protein